MLLAVGLLIGQLTAGLRLQAQVSVKREADARSLYEFARELSSALLPEQILASAGLFVHATFGSRCALYILGLDDRLKLASPAADDMPPLESALAQWVYDHGQPAGAGTATLSNSELLYLPLKAPMRTRGVLALAARRSLFSNPESRRQIEAYATLIAIALERLHYVEVAQQALVSMESEKLRNSLLAAVSHDLRTPLTSLVGMTDTLARQQPVLPADVQDTIRAMRDQAQRMHALVANLLDMAAAKRRHAAAAGMAVGRGTGGRGAGGHARTTGRAPGDGVQPVPAAAGGMRRRADRARALQPAGKRGAHASWQRHPAGRDRAGQGTAHLGLQWPRRAAGAERRIFQKFTRGERESATPGGPGPGGVRSHRHRPPWPHLSSTRRAGPAARNSFTLPLGEPPAIQPETP